MAETKDIIKRFLGEALKNIAHSLYDEYVEANVRFRTRSGMKSLIIRRELSKCCDWCHNLAGIYEYGKEPKAVYQRHDSCRCMVTFRNEEGKYEDVWSKKEHETQREARIERIKSFGNETTSENSITMEYLTKARPGKGSFVNELEGLEDKHPEEVTFAKLIYNIFGGDIVRRRELRNSDGSLSGFNPDYLWNGKLWDLKTPTTTKKTTLDKRIKHGLEQIGDNPGGLMLDFGKNSMSFEEAEKMATEILNARAKSPTDVILKKGNRFKVIHITKE